MIERDLAGTGQGESGFGWSAQVTVLAAAFLGWMFAGVEMSLLVSATRPAIQEFLAGPTSGPLGADIEVIADQWFSWYITAFLLGAAVGGAVFGWLGDRAGRVAAMGTSILCYSLVTGLSYFASTPTQLLILRFIACLGVGGMWPTGVALVSEAWPDVSRPTLAGLIGCSANVGFLILGLGMLWYPVTPASWRWVLLFGGSPVVLGLWVLRYVPESPEWLRQRAQPSAETRSPLRDVFRPPLLRRTLLGMVLGTIPLLGGWASGQRLVPWAGQVGQALDLPSLKATTQIAWAVGAVIGSLAGGWMANRLGRRLSYFLISALSLAVSLGIFCGLTPRDPIFPWAAFLLGLISTSFFGWLPYFLPELFPTAVRATGAGVSYNFGRILSAVAVLSTTQLSASFGGDIAKMGAVTSLIYGIGMLVIWLVPAQRGRMD